MNTTVRIGVGRDGLGWCDKFVQALREQQVKGLAFDFALVNLDADDWIEAVTPFDLVLWKPDYMGPVAASHFKEKVYFMETFLGKIVVPNFKTIWHFESKVAQTWLFRHAGVRTPKTFVSFDLKDAQEGLNKTEMPLVFKASHGASSRNVHLVKERAGARRRVDKEFFQQNWDALRGASSGMGSAFIKAITKGWIKGKVLENLFGRERYGVVYWQEFLAHNEADLRITVIGDNKAYGWWRRNRPGDFRASGSGLPDYERPIPQAPMQGCIDFTRRMGFDSMAYDILFKDEEFFVTEISYAFVDKYLYNIGGYYVQNPDGAIVFLPRKTWPQELWVEWALKRVGVNIYYGSI